MKFVRKLSKQNNKYRSIALPAAILRDWADCDYVEIFCESDGSILIRPY